MSWVKRCWKTTVWFSFLTPTGHTPHLSVKTQHGNFLCCFFLFLFYRQSFISAASERNVCSFSLWSLLFSLPCSWWTGLSGVCLSVCLFSRCKHLQHRRKKKSNRNYIKPIDQFFEKSGFFFCRFIVITIRKTGSFNCFSALVKELSL